MDLNAQRVSEANTFFENPSAMLRDPNNTYQEKAH
jgi:hypothetical protein